jgi:hypothetical protein
MTLTGVDDGDIEGDETVIVDITSVSNGTEDGVQRVTATITDDDLPSVTLSFVGGTSTLAENGGSVQVQATLSEAFSEDVTVTLGYTGTAGGSDYTGASQIVIPANSASESMTLTGVDDAEVEGNETVIIDITGVSNGTEDGVQQITATITDDDEAPPAAPTNVSVTPGNGALTVNFTPVSGETSYTATCKPSGGTPVTATGSGSSVTVTGLSNGVSYSCSVAVTGYSGVSDAAAPAAVAPAAPAPASAPTPVPTLGFFAQWLVSMLLGGLGVLGIRRRKKS